VIDCARIGKVHATALVGCLSLADYGRAVSAIKPRVLHCFDASILHR
jgi:hypothetical protein